MDETERNGIIGLYKEAFPQTGHEADAGYIMPDGAVIDISSKGGLYAHGREFITEPALIEWKDRHRDSVPYTLRQAADFIMDEIGAIEFTIDNCHIQSVRLPSKPLVAAQRQPLSEIVGRILERGKVRVEILGTREFAEYDAESHSAETVMSKIDAYYYSVGHLQA